MNFSSFSQDLTHSHFPLYMDTNSTTSDSPQSEIKNVKREDESKPTLSKDIYGTLDDELDDVTTGSDSQNLLTQPVDTSLSFFRQFEPICKFHLTEAFNTETITFQNLTEGLPYTEKPEMQSHVCNCPKDTNIKEDSFKEENSVGTEFSTSTKEEQLAHECVRQLSRSPPLVHSSGETLKFTETSPAKSAATEAALKPSQPQSFLYMENVHSDVKKPFDNENNFNFLDLRANYTTEEIVVSSKGVQSFEDVPDMPVCCQKEAPLEGLASPRIASPWFPAGIPWSGGAPLGDGMMPDTEQELESSQSLEEEMACEVLGKLEHTNRKQQSQIQDLQSSNKYLERKVEELQMQDTKQQVFVDIINELKAKVEELIEDKYRMMLEKSDTNKTLQNLHKVLTHTQNRLQEVKNEKETLQLELKRIKGNFVHLQEKYMTAVQQRDKTVSLCLQMNRTISEKEEEVERLQQLKGELEKATTSALDLKREKKTLEQEFLSLQEELQKHKKENLEERQSLKLRLEKLLAQVSHLQFISENEKAKNTQLQQQVQDVQQEIARLRQQVQVQSDAPQFETVQLQEHPGEAVEADGTKDITIPDAEHLKESKKVSDIMLQKLKHLYLKKENLDKEVLKHRAKITAFRELIAKETAFQDQIIELTVSRLVFLPTAKLGNLLESKEDHCNRLIEENDKYQRHLGNLINKTDTGKF
ncbi:cancer-associated gene 1 protein isoform X3 [Canis lupus familiaris]|uniref:Cancer antigen 1 n=3 Tax=Canis lupus familiaris TaxID=9615 RepID=A0A8P0TNH3_CANLF|nr:cancer-associated gene 1 protein isoform X3 [Canis lupus familiaris]XP_013965965.1 cancer-associated gene 1 protein isoform X3 [Canis lupus familiaris]XP_013965966.1 cancer-associated gene 1 protein isoform X3 [Canis lupus familiaris]XP_025300721.1 cancer-associated gene 1 protein isoform X3 [Canis lupus dingo]XP_025300727.1 cancer-associated gene 1 protein isoform X3 [Canis lupus dingo]XP_025300734.1 cancer-associated gene 1 protein isoform X3 [Canis lupus dingo]XP_038302240.1 cancer-asso|eukprot:XP_013965964.1 cancer-associated gene 1 protein isoform X3 [Canis lupus familiaris]